jgi:hypothetical protein
MVLAMALGCRAGKSVPEPGAVLLNVRCPASAPSPDELRAWVYDDGGRLWDGARIPEQGSLPAAKTESLGTILIAPGAIRGKLRIHLRGFAGGARVVDGLLTVDPSGGGDRSYDLMLDAALPADNDGDDVPDLIDDCPAVANPVQGGCPAPSLPDGGAAEDGGAESPREAPDGQAGRDAGTGDVRAGADDAATEVRGDGGQDTPAESELGGAAAEAGAGPAADSAEPGEVGEEAGTDVVVIGVDMGDDTFAATDAAGSEATDAAEGETAAACGEVGECGKPQGALCTTSAECASGACADGVCCANVCLGPCRSCNQPNSNGVCQGYAAGSDPEGECQRGSTCNGVGACGPPPTNLPNGQLCTSAGQCQSGHCSDGVCCDSDCTTPCMACGSGTCLHVKRTDDIPECTGAMTCNHKGDCVSR